MHIHSARDTDPESGMMIRFRDALSLIHTYTERGVGVKWWAGATHRFTGGHRRLRCNGLGYRRARAHTHTYKHMHTHTHVRDIHTHMGEGMRERASEARQGARVQSNTRLRIYEGLGFRVRAVRFLIKGLG